MCFFRKKLSNKEKILKSREDTNKNTQTIEILLVMAEDNEAMRQELLKLQDTLKYLTPSSADEVKKIDEKISHNLDDLKIELSKGDKEKALAKAESTIKDIKLLLAQRKVYTNK